MDAGTVELRMRGPQLPTQAEITRALGPLPFEISELTVFDDWRRRRLDDYRPDEIGGRLVARPAWAPPARDGSDRHRAGGERRMLVRVTIATLRFPDRGVVRVSGQAIVRQGA